MSSIYFPPSLRQYEPKRMVFSTWVDHLPFGYDLVEAIRPSKVVELGAYNGMSYFTFCQSMIENDIDGICYAVDTWAGDDHTGGYDDSIYNDVRDHARQCYRGITYLMRMLFNEAVEHFQDEEIGLLHIDGLHTYEAVTEDFNTWYPKVQPGGIILFHDIQARMKDYGVWRYWEELSPQYESFAFNHGWGLGVLRKPGGEPNDHPLLNLLFSGDEATHHQLRQFYVHAGHHFEAKRQAARLKKQGNKGGAGKAPAKQE